MRRPASPRSAERTALLRVERIGADGDGVSHPLPGSAAGESAVYVPLTLPGETVRARITGERGTVDAIVEPSADRVAPPCPHFGACGGCTLQHWRDANYIAWKAGQLEAAFRRAGSPEAELRASFRTAPAARRRMDLAFRRTASGVAVGLHRIRASEIIDLQTCLVVHPALRDLIAPLRALLPRLALLRREGSAVVNLLDSGPDLLLRSDGEPTTGDRAALAGFAGQQGIARIFWAKGSGPPEPVCVLRPARIGFTGGSVTPPPGAFLQASPEGEQAIVASVLAGLPERLPARAHLIELYAGCGTLTFALAGRARVSAFEGDTASVAALRRGAGEAGLAGRVSATQRDLARQPLTARELAGVASVVLDPPDAGAAAQMPALIEAKVPRVIYVSCNPTALGRDAALLHRAGYTLLAVTLVDQFLWSARIESVCVFARPCQPRA